MLERTLYWVLCSYNGVLRMFAGRSSRQEDAPPILLLTGTFHSSNWINAHLQPMLDSSRFQRVVMVSTSAVDFPEAVEVLRPPSWLRRIGGDVGSRLLMFIFMSLRLRPQMVGGFHLLFNGLAAILLARVIGARSLYFCVGGPAEVCDGGLLSENKLFARIGKASPRIERQLLRAVGHADAVVCMGSNAAAFMRERTDARLVVVNPGCVPHRPFRRVQKRYDLVFLGRLAPIKNVPLLLESIARLRAENLPVTLAVVGDGDQRPMLEAKARDLGIADLVTFAGMQTDTEQWLAESRVFVLTSISEGLSLSLMEALSSALPAIVPDVGDLGDLVKDHYNGRLLTPGDVEELTQAIRAMLSDGQYEKLSRAAAQSAAYVSPARAAARWAHTMQHLGWNLCAV